jgi:hypothetical protein
MKGGLNGLISSTSETPSIPHKMTTSDDSTIEKPTGQAVHCNFVIDRSIHSRMKLLSISRGKSLKTIINEAMVEYLDKYEH